MPTTFCVCYGGGHVKMIAPVLLKLIELVGDVKVLGLTTAYSYLYNLGIKALGFKDFIDPIKDQYALEIGKILAKGVIHSSVSLEESIAYLGISYAELEKKAGKEEAKKILWAPYPRTCLFPCLWSMLRPKSKYKNRK